MKDPKPMNLKTTDEVMRQGWVAEARDADGHLISTQAWLDVVSINENFRMLGDFINDYDGEGGTTVQVFTGTVAKKLEA